MFDMNEFTKNYINRIIKGKLSIYYDLDFNDLVVTRHILIHDSDKIRRYKIIIDRSPLYEGFDFEVYITLESNGYLWLDSVFNVVKQKGRYCNERI